MSSIVLEGEPAELEAWFDHTRAKLYDRWATATGHGVDGSGSRWACEIYYGCRTCNEHVSLACSLSNEAHEIGEFLKNGCSVSSPSMFLRYYLITLSEFVNGLKDVAGLLKIAMPKPPTSVCLWANRYAKHRLHLLVQHHPLSVFADAYGEAWPAFSSELPSLCLRDRCGTRHQLTIIDSDWLSRAEGNPDLTEANDESQSLIVVPPLMGFLDDTISYFRLFVDRCLENSEVVKQFESAHQRAGCY